MIPALRFQRLQFRGLELLDFPRADLVEPEPAKRGQHLVRCDFTTTGPDQLWVADITYVATWAGFLYLAIVLVVWSRRIVGWAMSTSLMTDAVLDRPEVTVRVPHCRGRRSLPATRRDKLDECTSEV